MGDVTVIVPGWMVTYLSICLGIMLLLSGIQSALWIWEWRIRRRAKREASRV